MDDFEAGSGNWDITNDGGTCVWEVWDISTNGYTMPAEAILNVLAADADVCGLGTTLLSTATMNFGVNATDWLQVWIEFDNDLRILDGKDEFYLECSVDGGAGWTEVASWIGVGNRNTHEVWDISGMAATQSDVRIRLRSVQPGWDWWWAIDNFAIYFDMFIPVELTSFAAIVNENDAVLSWSTATETNNMGFEVQRSSNGSDYSRIAFVEGHGTVSEAQNYSFTDQNLEVGTYTYRLKQIDFDGTSEFSNAVEVEILAPDVYALEQNYPNPFNPSTKIKFSLAADSKVTLTVFDILGQEVANLISGNLPAGSHEIIFNASNINSGVYFYRIDATGVDGSNFSSIKKMILMK
ncbi:MAG: T9SS type A sorting domain-containing protein [Bacteroidetes bacterium]|nr:T9SS type A sorting domain-containing protein [Bacteroidota bacterium]